MVLISDSVCKGTSPRFTTTGARVQQLVATQHYTLLVLREGEGRECTGTAPLDSVEDGASSCEFHCNPDMLVRDHAFSDALPVSTKLVG